MYARRSLDIYVRISKPKRLPCITLPVSNRTERIATAPVPPNGGHALVVALGEVQRRGDRRRLQALALVHAVAHLVAEPRTAAVRAGRLAQKRSIY